MRKLVLITFFIISGQWLSAQSEYPLKGTMDNYTMFGFSQWYLTEEDTQVFVLEPDMNIRAWQKWNTDGAHSSDFDFSIVTDYHNHNVTFIGGGTATVLFYDETTDSAQFLDFVTYNGSGQPVTHNEIVSGAYRGNMANPAYRDYVVSIMKLQIDGGVDGLFFDEALAGYDGNAITNYNGNEGFDDYHLKDFNTFLAQKYPNYTMTDWINNFGMTDTNYINTSNPLDNLDSNFNYREYLQVNGFQNNPMSSSNKLVGEWGLISDGRADVTSDNFIAKYTVLYWQDIVSQVRTYARTTYNKEIFITSNGLLPYVDFNGLGMFNYNKDANGAQADYVPVTGQNLNGAFSLQNVFESLYQRSSVISDSAPVVLFIDWPTTMMSDYQLFSPTEKEDYWKIYTAEAYANGLFMAFNLKTSLYTGIDTTAYSEGILYFLKNYAAFYHRNSSFYQQNQILNTAITCSQSNINKSLMYQPAEGRYTLHLVNHNYATGTRMAAQSNFTVSLPLDSAPLSAYMISPDFTDTVALSSSYNGENLTITVNSLNYYDVVVLDYKNVVTAVTNPQSTGIITAYPNPVNDIINFSNLPSNAANVQITDVTGRLVKQGTISGSGVDVSGLNQGVYIYTILGNDGSTLYTSRFVK